jgi:hypothetical protein
MRYGIKVKNPLPKPVRVEVISGNLILSSVVLPATCEAELKLDKGGPYDIRTTIINRVKGAIDDDLGPASFRVLNHVGVKRSKAKEADEDVPIRSLSDMFDEMKKKEVAV